MPALLFSGFPSKFRDVLKFVKNAAKECRHNVAQMTL